MIGRSTVSCDSRICVTQSAHRLHARHNAIALTVSAPQMHSPCSTPFRAAHATEWSRAPLTAAGLLLQAAEHAFDGYAAIVVDQVGMLDLVALTHRSGTCADRDATTDVFAVADRARALVQH